MLFRDPQALSTLAALGMLQPRAFGSLNNIYPLISLSNYYIDYDHETFIFPLRMLAYIETC